MKTFHEKRISAEVRDKFAETKLSPRDFVMPYFVVEGENTKSELASMPGVFHFSIDKLIIEVNDLEAIDTIMLFGVPGDKTKDGLQAYAEDGIVQRAVRALKKSSAVKVITDVCLCGYTTHGHCGIIGRGQIDNIKTLEVLSKIAVSHAAAGADMVAPSAMMDGQVGAIRQALDADGFKDTGILAYSAKYASNFYGPFRDAARSAPEFGDRKTYQMDYRNSEEAMEEIEADIREGADIVMVKPALSYLDIISKAKERFDISLAAYNVSGEYAMVKRMAGGDRQTEKELALEILTSIKRAGAGTIITYWAKEAAGWIK